MVLFRDREENSRSIRGFAGLGAFSSLGFLDVEE